MQRENKVERGTNERRKKDKEERKGRRRTNKGKGKAVPVLN
jgi:hypothetical protein